MVVRILVPNDSSVARDGWFGAYLLRKAMICGKFLFKEEKISGSDLGMIVKVEKGNNKRSWDLANFFTAERCQSLADRFRVVVRVDNLGYVPSNC